MKIGLFIPCHVDAVYPEVGVATWKLLKHQGLDVTYPEKQTCCGQPMANAGFEKQAIPLAAKFEEKFQGFDYVVSPSVSCTAFIRLNYPRLLQHECETAKRCMDVVEFLHDVVKVDRRLGTFPHNYLVIEVDGVPCTCGKRGCAERYCSATAIIRMAREACADAPNCMIMREANGNMENITAKIVLDAAKAGDPAANQVFRRFVKYLTIAINNVISSLDPDMIILGGGVSRAGDFLLDAVKETLEDYLFYPTLPRPELRIASLGNDAGIIGAALLGKE